MAVDIELACNLVQAKLATLQPQFLAQVPLDMEHYPTAMADELCPYAMTWPGDGSWYQKGGGYKVDIRTCTVFVFVESLRQKDMATRTLQGTRVLQAVRNLFIIPANIPLDYGNTSGYQITLESAPGTPHSDTGLRGDFPFTGSPWMGFSIALKVRIMWQ